MISISIVLALVLVLFGAQAAPGSGWLRLEERAERHEAEAPGAQDRHHLPHDLCLFV